MRLGIVSDTHGNLENLRRVAEKITDKWEVDFIVHLGDECEDVKVLDEFEVEVIQVPGVYCDQYQDAHIENRILCQFDGYRILLTHTDSKHKNDLPGDPDPKALAAGGGADVILYGHSHVPEIRHEGQLLWINPGHLKDQDKKGYAPSFAILETSSEGIKVQLIEAKTGRVFKQTELKREQG